MRRSVTRSVFWLLSEEQNLAINQWGKNVTSKKGLSITGSMPPKKTSKGKAADAEATVLLGQLSKRK